MTTSLLTDTHNVLVEALQHMLYVERNAWQEQVDAGYGDSPNAEAYQFNINLMEKALLAAKADLWPPKIYDRNK